MGWGGVRGEGSCRGGWGGGGAEGLITCGCGCEFIKLDTPTPTGSGGSFGCCALHPCRGDASPRSFGLFARLALLGVEGWGG